jgi:hypothetical protein
MLKVLTFIGGLVVCSTVAIVLFNVHPIFLFLFLMLVFF